MKVSRWLTLINVPDGGTLAWSSYTGALAKVNAEFLSVIEALKTGYEIDTSSALVREMLRCGFIAEDDTDELSLYGALIEREKHRKDTLKLVIAPTLSCNFSCPYCFEHHRDVKMSAAVQNAITDYVNQKLNPGMGGLRFFSVVWYGGEPLLEKDIIAGLSEAFLKMSSPYGVRYSASIITNGYLVDEDTAKLLKDCDVSFAQVTVDGSHEVHNKRRILRASPSEGTYGRIIEGINFLEASGIKVTVRMNIDRENSEETERNIASLAKVIKDKSKVSFSPGLVTDYDGGEKSSACLTKEEYGHVILECIKHCKAHGLHFSPKSSRPKLRASYCTATLPGSFVIDPEGFVYKCWNDIGIKEYSIGTVDGLASGHESSEWESYSQMDYETCRDCGLLPVCAGGCPRGCVHSGGLPECESFKYVLDDLLIFQAEGGEVK